MLRFNITNTFNQFLVVSVNDISNDENAALYTDASVLEKELVQNIRVFDADGNLSPAHLSTERPD